MIDKIKAHIHDLEAGLVKGACSSQISMESARKAEAYNEILAYIESIEKKPVMLGGPIHVKGDYELKDAKARELLAGSLKFVTAYDGESEPDVTKIPEGVIVSYFGKEYVGTMTADSADPLTFYIVRDGDKYHEYVAVGIEKKTWEKMGTIDAPRRDPGQSLEDACNKWVDENEPDYPDVGWETCDEKMRDAFKAGYEYGCRHTAVIYDDMEKERQRRCEEEKSEIPIIRGWVARDIHGTLRLYGNDAADGMGIRTGELPSPYKELTAEDEPIEVELTISRVIK